MQRTTDLMVHAWDIAMGIGAVVEVEDELAEALLAINRPMVTDGLRNGVIFGPEVVGPDAAPAMDGLVAFLGRQPEQAVSGPTTGARGISPRRPRRARGE